MSARSAASSAIRSGVPSREPVVDEQDFVAQAHQRDVERHDQRRDVGRLVIGRNDDRQIIAQRIEAGADYGTSGEYGARGHNVPSDRGAAA